MGSRKHKIFAIIGTRPDAIKMAPVIKALEEINELEPIVIATAQHRQMLDQVLSAFELRVHYDLNIMKEGQDLDYITIESLKGLGRLMDEEKPSMVVVQGDTTTSFVGGLAAFYRNIPVAHVEAGLRTGDLRQPFPEEANRRLLDAISELLFPPTEKALKNLLNEGIDPKKCTVTGNTAIDALLWMVSKGHKISDPELEKVASAPEKKLILVTAHRRESFGKPLEEFVDALKELAERFDNINIVYPVHMNPNVNNVVREKLTGIKRIYLPKPLDYPDFVALMSKAYLILTDSGGIQEEAPALGIPVLVLRQVTERPEGVEAGAAKVVGMNKKKIVEETERLLTDPNEYRKMAKKRFIYGDGKASKRIVKRILDYLQK